MKVNIVSTFTRNCGIGQYTEHLGKQLSKQELDVQVYRKDGPDDDVFNSYPYRSFRSWQHRVAPFFLRQAIRKQEADLWHADYVSSFDALACARVGKQSIVTVHDAIPFHYPGNAIDFRFYKNQLKKAIKQAKFLVTVSETARLDLIKQAGVDPSKVVSIPNGINVSAFQPKTKPEEYKVFTIRYLGGLGAPHKNVAMLLYMAQMLEQDGIDFKLELGGYLPERHALRDLVAELELKNVAFPGFIPDEEKANFLAGADLFVFPSLMEGFGFPPMEAMAAGTAVLASNIPVFEELIGDAALLVDPKAEWFARGVKDIMKSKTLAEDLSMMGQEHVRQYTWDRVAQQTLALYQRALN
ncbi:MAG: glycosyltransferase family 1 protein [Cytophagales bacterium]|nr:glycosyltransferase family 1 protein [Cytophagales bacterium]